MPWPQEGSGMFDARVMETEFLNGPGDDPALVAGRCGNDHKATVLIGQLEITIFKEAVHEDDELAHAGGHRDERFLACCP